MCLSRSIAKFFLVLAIGWLSLGSQISAAQEKIEFPLSELIIESEGAEHRFVVELADTPERRAHGYMFREDIPKGTGMLFDFEAVRPVAMWMRNTPTSLDMLFIDAEGKIRHIFQRTEPFSEAVLASPINVLAVLEVVAGTVEELGISLGDRIRHPLFER